MQSPSDAQSGQNPYASPASHVDDVEPSGGDQAEAIRKEHLNHEASVRSIGSLHYISAVGVLLGALAITVPAFNRGSFGPGYVAGSDLLIAAFLFALGVGLLFVGHGLRHLKRWTRIPTILLSMIGLLGFPVGTLVNAYILWLVISKKGRRVFAADYQAIIAATPHIKYKTSIIVWIFLGIIVLLIAWAVLATRFK